MDSRPRRFLPVACTLAAVLLAAAPAAALGPGLHAGRTVDVGGTARTYDLYVPAGYDGSTAYPLVLDFHFLGGTAGAWASGSGFRALADTAQFLVAFPQGLGGYWNAGTCCPPGPTADDVGFARAVVADVAAHAVVDPGRVYATGYSMGSAMAHRLACDAADVFAAVAPFAAQLVVPFLDCEPAQPVAVLYTHGLDDVIVPYGGGPTQPFPSISVPPAVDSFRFLAQANGCCTDCLANPASEPSTVIDTLGDADPATRCETYAACSGGVAVELCSERLGHSVPGNGPARAWAFMQTHARSATSTTTTTTTPSSTTTTTMPAAACATEPRVDCAVARTSVLKLSDGGVGRRTVGWTWKSASPLLPADIGDPTQASSYALCAYDETGVLFYAAAVPAGATCDAAPCWKGVGKPAGVAGWKLKDRAGRHGGITTVVVKPGDGGKGKAVVKGREASAGPLPFPALPLAAVEPRVQLQVGGAGCIEAQLPYTAANLPGKYVGKSAR